MTIAQKRHISLLLIAGLILLLAGGGVVFYGSVTSLSKNAVERLASRHLGVKVEVDELDIDPERESVLIRGLTINNPRGYKRGAAITIGAIDIDARSLERERLMFEDIKVSGMNIRVEVSETGTNLSTLKQIIGTRATDQTLSKIEPVKVVIDHVVFTGTRIEPGAVTEAIAKDLSPQILPEIHLRAIGENDQGLAAPEAVSQIIIHVINVALRAAAEEGYLDSLSPAIQMQIGARLSVSEQLLEDAKAVMQRAPSDVEALEKTVRKVFKVNE
jgi:hypothetical protein